MKTKLTPFFIILSLVNSSPVLSAESAAPSATKSQYNKLLVNEDMQKVLEISAVDKIYQNCLKDYPDETKERMSKVSGCLWTNVQKDENLKKEVLATMNAKPKSSSRAPASEKDTTTKTDYTDKKINVTNDYQSDPAVQALSEFYGKKLAEVLDPESALTAKEKKANTIGIVDHRKYIDLYKSQIGKTIINAFTSYCIEAVPTCGKIIKNPDTKEEYRQDCHLDDIPSQREEDKKANIASLKGQSLDLDSKSESSEKWTFCITNVTEMCTNPPNNSNYTKQKACTIVDYVKSARKSLMEADKQVAFYNDLAKTQTNASIDFKNAKRLDDKDNSSNDNLGMITAKDVKDSLKKVAENDEEELSKCFSANTNEDTGEIQGKILDEELCKKYLNTNKEENQKALAEFSLRQEMKASDLEENIKDDEYLKTYLKEEGYTEAQIGEMTKDKIAVEDIRGTILARFKNEKDALIAEMSQKIEETTTTVDGKVTEADITKLQQIKAELLSRPSDLSQLVQFNNLVSSYLIIDESGGSADDKEAKQSRNIASLFAEAETFEGEEAKIIQEKIKEAKLENKKNTAELAIDSLNDNFLGYKKK